jgi:hypothetical protein
MPPFPGKSKSRKNEKTGRTAGDQKNRNKRAEESGERKK